MIEKEMKNKTIIFLYIKSKRLKIEAFFYAYFFIKVNNIKIDQYKQKKQVVNLLLCILNCSLTTN
jgi:hypothetical protein